MALAAKGLIALAFGAAGLVACGGTPLDSITVDPRSLLPGLVAHWTFDEGSGTTVGDYSGNGHDGALNGGTWIRDGRFGGALQLALQDYVIVSVFQQPTTSWTVSAWIRMSSAQLDANIATNDYGTILSTELPLAGGYQLQLDNRDTFRRLRAAYWPTSGGSYVVDNCECEVVDQWIHLTEVFDDVAQKFTLYEGTSVAAEATMPGPIATGDSTLYMGKWEKDARFLAADLDDFAIWSRALTAGEVAILSQQPPTE
ncbi:MAG: LamG domain-containing protein [Pseudomonadota bacterium]